MGVRLWAGNPWQDGDEMKLCVCGGGGGDYQTAQN